MKAALKIILAGFNRAQRVLDPGFANALLTTLGGSGIGTSAISGGALTIVSASSTYTITPTYQPGLLERGSYSVTYTISGYVSGGISICSSLSASLASPTDGTERTANGTYTETIVLTSVGYIGLRGRSGVVSSMTIDDLTILRVA